MSLPNPVKILGVEGSPYSRKLRAVLRYRRIPFLWLSHGSREAALLPKPKIDLAPQMFLQGADGTLEARTDSTPLIRMLETQQAERAVRPADPVIAMLDSLLEDFADEWLTKSMFHYRWAFGADADTAARWIPCLFSPNQPQQGIARAGVEFRDRQVERLAVVGSNPTTGPVIERSYRRTLELLDARCSASRFLFGDRPSVADFGLYGQLTQLARIDPTPAALARASSMRVVAWTDLMEDLSGIEPSDGDWCARDAVHDTLKALLGEVGRVYVPFFLANAQALEAGASEVNCEIDGADWVQNPFAYQGKCLRWLREEYTSLRQGDREDFDKVLAGTGCEPLFEG
jgi:glutathione S-transferase